MSEPTSDRVPTLEEIEHRMSIARDPDVHATPSKAMYASDLAYLLDRVKDTEAEREWVQSVAENRRILLERLEGEQARGEWCAVCGKTGRGRIRVHRECVIHKHVEVDGVESIIPRPQEDWAELWNRAETALAQVDALREALRELDEGWKAYVRARNQDSGGGMDRAWDQIKAARALAQETQEPEEKP